MRVPILFSTVMIVGFFAEDGVLFISGTLLGIVLCS